jgi:hypothetical protein
MSERLPEDPFVPGGDGPFGGEAFRAIARAEMLWSTLADLDDPDERRRGVDSLSLDDLRAMVAARLARMRFRIDREGAISFERDEPEPDEDLDEEPER